MPVSMEDIFYGEAIPSAPVTHIIGGMFNKGASCRQPKRRQPVEQRGFMLHTFAVGHPTHVQYMLHLGPTGSGCPSRSCPLVRETKRLSDP